MLVRQDGQFNQRPLSIHSLGKDPAAKPSTEN